MNIFHFNKNKSNEINKKTNQDVLKEQYESLISLINNTPELNKSSKYKKLKEELIEKLNRLNDNKLKILISAPVNTGKSTFINLLYDRKLLIPSKIACCALSLEIKNSYFNSNKEEVHLLQNSNETIYFIYKFQSDDIQEMLNNDDEKQRINCTIYCKPGENSILNTENFDISTTEIEGIGKALEDEVILYKSQSKFDCVIFLVKPGENINNDSMRFLKKCREINNFTYIFFIMNQWDTVVKENERKKMKEKFFKQVEKNFPESIKNNLVHFISAETELKAIENQKEVSKEYKELQNRLKNFIFNDRFISKTSPYIKFLENKSNDILNFLSETKEINNLKIKILERIKTEKWKRDNINNEIKGTSLNILIKNEKIKNYLCNNTNDGTFILKYIENRLEDFNDINKKINKMLSEKLSEFFYEENLSKILNKDNHGNFNSSFDVYICTTKKLINESFIDNFSDLNSSIKKDIENKTIEWLGKEAYNNNIINPIEEANDIIEIKKFNLELNTDSNFFERLNLWCTNILFSFQEIFNIINKKSKSDKINSKIFNYINDSRKDNEIDKKIIEFYTESTINSIHKFFKNEFFLKFSDMAFQNLCKIIILNELYNYFYPNAFSKQLFCDENFNYDEEIYELIENFNNSNFLTFYEELKKQNILKINFDDEIKFLKTRNKVLSSKIENIRK